MPKNRTSLIERWAWVTVPLLLAAVIAVWWTNVSMVYVDPRLQFVLHFIFATVTSSVVVYMFSRNFIAKREIGFLLLACAAIFWSMAGILAAALGARDFNASTTIHNLCFWQSAVLHLWSVVSFNHKRKMFDEPELWLCGGLAASAIVATVVAILSLASGFPVFFVQGEGGTVIRHFVLGSAILMFSASAALLFGKNSDGRSFTYWYGLSLLLLAVGLFGVMIQHSVGSALSWVGRTAQWIGGIYLLGAAVAAAREKLPWDVSLSNTPSTPAARPDVAPGTQSQTGATHRIRLRR